MHRVRIIGVALAIAAGLVVGGTAQSAHAAGSKNLTVQYGAKVLKNETVRFSGKVSSSLKRPIKLQYKSGSTWKTDFTSETYGDGSFTFYRSTSKTRSFRYYAPAHDGLPKIVGNPKKVSVVSQKVRTIKLVRDTQCHFGGSSLEPVTVYAEFSPARWGRRVDLRTDTNGTVTDYQDRHGRVAISFTPPSVDGTYHAVAKAQSFNDASSTSSKNLTYQVTTCVIIVG